MEKFEGIGAECYQKYHENGHKGTIHRMDHGEFLVLIPTWLSAPCTYTPPEPKWIECSAGEALDAYLRVENVQENSGSGWVDMTYDTAWQWMWVNKGVKYRKEA